MPRAGHPPAPLEHKGRARDPQANPSPTFSLSRRLPLSRSPERARRCHISVAAAIGSPSPFQNCPGALTSSSSLTASARSSRSALEPSPSASFPDYIRPSSSLDPRLSNELRHHRAFFELRCELIIVFPLNPCSISFHSAVPMCCRTTVRHG